MDDQSTTDSTPIDSGAQEALPEQQVETSAEQSTSEQAINETSGGEEESSVPQVDDKLQKYAESHGIALDSEGAIKAAQIAMNNQSNFSRERQRSTELEKATDKVTDQQIADYEQRTGETLSETDIAVQRLVLRDSIRTYFEENPEAKRYESKMAEIVSQKPHLMGDYDALYALALRENSESLKSEAGKDALRTLANKQRATAPTGSAVTNSPATPKITRSLMNEKLQSGDTEWFSNNRDEINRMVADGTLQ